MTYNLLDSNEDNFYKGMDYNKNGFYKHNLR